MKTTWQFSGCDSISIQALSVTMVLTAHLHSAEEFPIPQLLPLSGFLWLSELHENHVFVGSASPDESKVADVFSCLVSNKAQQI
jgi:hypothetical protein